jgi:hypothetical protein
VGGFVADELAAGLDAPAADHLVRTGGGDEVTEFGGSPSDSFNLGEVVGSPGGDKPRPHPFHATKIRTSVRGVKP